MTPWPQNWPFRPKLAIFMEKWPFLAQKKAFWGSQATPRFQTDGQFWPFLGQKWLIFGPNVAIFGPGSAGFGPAPFLAPEPSAAGKTSYKNLFCVKYTVWRLFRPKPLFEKKRTVVQKKVKINRFWPKKGLFWIPRGGAADRPKKGPFWPKIGHFWPKLSKFGQLARKGGLAAQSSPFLSKKGALSWKTGLLRRASCGGRPGLVRTEPEGLQPPPLTV